MDKHQAILDSRSRVLATLVDAYLATGETIHVIHHLNGIAWLSGGLPRDFNPSWSHVTALASEGMLILQQTGRHDWSIDIPSAIIARLRSDSSQPLNLSPGPDRIERLTKSTVFNNHFYGGNINVAQGSKHVVQNVHVASAAGDLAALLDHLEQIGLSRSLIDSLGEAAKGDAEEAAGPKYGSKMKAWFADLTSKIIAEGVVAVGASTIPDSLELISNISSSLEAFSG